VVSGEANSFILQSVWEKKFGLPPH
jgi:hypothetical protein